MTQICSGASQSELAMKMLSRRKKNRCLSVRNKHQSFDVLLLISHLITSQTVYAAALMVMHI